MVCFPPRQRRGIEWIQYTSRGVAVAGPGIIQEILQAQQFAEFAVVSDWSNGGAVLDYEQISI